MNKVFNSLFVIIAAMVTFAGCAKQEIDAPATPETKTVQFFANSIETKTVFGEPNNEGVYPTLWSAGDKVDISLNFEDPKTSSEVECSADNTSARFTVNDLTIPEEGPYTFYSISPVDRLRGVSSKYSRLYVEILSDQAPLETSVDMEAQLLFAASETTETFTESVELKYKHLTAYGKFSLTNLAHQSVSKIKIEAPENVFLAGKWDYFVADGSFKVRSGNGLNSITLTTTRTTDIWFACAPVDVSNMDLTLTVTTDEGDLVKKLEFPENRKFEAGRIAKFTVDMAGIEVGGTDDSENPSETTSYYKKVTSAPADWSGTYLMVCDSKNMVLSSISTTSTKYGVGTSVTISDNQIEATETLASYQVVLSPGSTSGSYLMKFKDGYLYWSSGNSLAINANNNSNTNWLLSVSDGNVTIKNCKDNARVIGWNASSPRFACYTSTQTAIQLYKLYDGNTGGETPEQPEQPTLSSRNLAFSSTTATATVGQAFTVPTLSGVTTGVTYSSSNTAVAEVNVSTGAVTLVGAGTTTITATAPETEQYEAGTATYTLTVSAAPEGGDDSAESVTVSNTIAKIATANSWVNSTKYTSFELDDVITVSAVGGTNTGKYYTSGNNWRIYQNENPTLTISADEAYKIKTVKVSYVVEKTGVLTYNNSNIASETVVNVNADSIAFGVGNTGSATNGQVRVTAIEVVYQKN